MIYFIDLHILTIPIHKVYNFDRKLFKVPPDPPTHSAPKTFAHGVLSATVEGFLVVVPGAGRVPGGRCHSSARCSLSVRALLRGQRRPVVRKGGEGTSGLAGRGGKNIFWM